MKKYLLLAFAALVLTPVSSFADSWTKTVTNASEFKAAVKAIGVGVPGETYEIICDWEPGTAVSCGKLGTPYMMYGRVFIHSNQTKFDNMPEVIFSMEQGWVNGTDSLKKAEDGMGLSLIFENLKINAGGRSYFIDAQKTQLASADTIAFRRCELYNSKRSWIRWDGPANEDCKLSVLKNLEFTECLCHSMNMSSGDNWSMTRVFTPVKNMIWKDCVFYDMQYTKSLWEGRYPGDDAANVTFANNLVLLAQNKNVATTGFTVLMPGANLGTGAELEIANNIFVGPQAGLHIMHGTPVEQAVVDENGEPVLDAEGNPVKEPVPTYYNNTEITNIQGATVYFDNNVVDEASYKSIASEIEKFAAYATPSTGIAGTNYVLGEGVHQIDWTAGATFQDPEKDMYYMLKSNPWYTDGLGLDVEDLTSPTYIGPSIAYLDAFPVPATIDVKVDGPSFCSYQITPAKSQYYVGDEVTISGSDLNNAYREFTTFEGWTGAPADVDATAKSFTTTLTGDLNLTAKFQTKVNPISAFTFSNVTGSKMSAVDADIYYNFDDAYKAQVTMVTYAAETTEQTTTDENGETVTETVTTGNFIETVGGEFETRKGKFQEDDQEVQMNIVSRRTPSNVKLNKRNYAVVKFSTKDFTNITVGGFVGTDNNGSKIQKLEYSLDAETWNELTQGEIIAHTWLELQAALPEACENQEVVYVRFISDPTAEPIVWSVTGWCDEEGKWTENGEQDYLKADAFEYVGNILIAGNNTTSIKNVNAQNNVKTIAIYNLAGQKVSKDFRGIVIENGKKVIK